MTKSTDQRESWWRTMESAIVQYGPSLYLGLHRIKVLDATAADDLWVAVFTQTFRQIRVFQRTSDRWAWLQGLALSLAVDRKLPVDAAQFSANVTLREMNPTETDNIVQATGTQRNRTASPSQSSAVLVIPERTWTQLRKHLLAIEALRDAEQRRKGPSWSPFALIGTTVVGLIAVFYGIAAVPNAGASVHGSGTQTKLAAQLPRPLSNLPTTTQAQFRVKQPSALPSLAHSTVTSTALYVPLLASDSSGHAELTIRRAAFSASGKSWLTASTFVGKIVLTVPNAPTSPSHSGGTQAPQNLANWQLLISGNWAVAVVSWTNGPTPTSTAVQIYRLNLSTHQSKLVKSFQAKAGVGSVYVAAAGAGRIVVQPGVTEGTGGSASVVGLPIQVYNLTSETNTVLSQVTQIPGAFGLMQSPSVTSSGILFQGISGQPQDITAINATWYQLSWDGNLARLQGPPIDNQEHWVVESTDGQMWWAETTPATQGPSGAKQVLMGRLSPAGTPANTPALTLSGSVNQFAVSGSHLVWEQKDGNVTQIVVSEVTQ